ncbi:SDR family oxidoreductase [Streptomyces sp. NPDC001185]|uniref:SDR family oxidoreductase n=1 Tax=Streptomyces sp. NPDC001185 TaxID=3154380 RepID=UPI0033205CF9
MRIENSTALVTGANRGLGREFTRQLLARGARRVYATARDPRSIDVDGAVPLKLDVTDVASVDAAVRAAPDVDLLINNAGIATMQPVLTGNLDTIRREVETNAFGTLQVTRGFAPTLGRNGGGGIVTVLSAASWYAVPGNAAYSVSKAAAWNLNNAFRVELANQHTQVLGAHAGLIDTDMTAGWDFPKISAEEFVTTVLDGLAAGEIEVVADDFARRAKASLSGPPTTLSL